MMGRLREVGSYGRRTAIEASGPGIGVCGCAGTVGGGAGSPAGGDPQAIGRSGAVGVGEQPAQGATRGDAAGEGSAGSAVSSKSPPQSPQESAAAGPQAGASWGESAGSRPDRRASGGAAVWLSRVRRRGGQGAGRGAVHYGASRGPAGDDEGHHLCGPVCEMWRGAEHASAPNLDGRGSGEGAGGSTGAGLGRGAQQAAGSFDAEDLQPI